jgi:hypothetical protein
MSVPIKRLKVAAVRCGCVMSRSFAICPTRISPFSSTLTTDGVLLALIAFGIISGPFSLQYATRLFVVPRSMPGYIKNIKAMYSNISL